MVLGQSMNKPSTMHAALDVPKESIEIVLANGAAGSDEHHRLCSLHQPWLDGLQRKADACDAAACIATIFKQQAAVVGFDDLPCQHQANSDEGAGNLVH